MSHYLVTGIKGPETIRDQSGNNGKLKKEPHKAQFHEKSHSYKMHLKVLRVPIFGCYHFKKSKVLMIEIHY